ncbi:unnamed protein product [Rhizopus stolonifer]
MNFSTSSGEEYEEVVIPTGGELSHFTEVIGANKEIIQEFYEMVPTNHNIPPIQLPSSESMLKTPKEMVLPDYPLFRDGQRIDGLFSLCFIAQESEKTHRVRFILRDFESSTGIYTFTFTLHKSVSSKNLYELAATPPEFELPEDLLGWILRRKVP